MHGRYAGSGNLREPGDGPHSRALDKRGHVAWSRGADLIAPGGAPAPADCRITLAGYDLLAAG